MYNVQGFLDGAMERNFSTVLGHAGPSVQPGMPLLTPRKLIEDRNGHGRARAGPRLCRRLAGRRSGKRADIVLIRKAELGGFDRRRRLRPRPAADQPGEHRHGDGRQQAPHAGRASCSISTAAPEASRRWLCRDHVVHLSQPSCRRSVASRSPARRISLEGCCAPRRPWRAAGSPRRAPSLSRFAQAGDDLVRRADQPAGGADQVLGDEAACSSGGRKAQWPKCRSCW